MFEPALSLEEEGSTVERADVLLVQLKRSLPVGKRPVGIAGGGFRLAAEGDQIGIVVAAHQARLDHGASVVELARRHVCARQQPTLPWLVGCGCVSFAVERGHVVDVCERRHRRDQLVVHLLVVGI